MKYVLIGLVFAVSLVGCGVTTYPTYMVDQNKRAELFQQCMKALPAGPSSTRYNDWDEVVKACDNVALQQAKFCAANCTDALLPETKPQQ